MADKSDKKSLRKRRGKKGQSEEEKLTKDETEVAKYLRWNSKTKKSVMYGDEVYYFTGSKIVDLMLDSKWASGKAKKSSIQFTDRESTYFLLDKMIALGLFSRVHRIYKEKEKKGKDKDKKDEKKKSKDEKPKTETNDVEMSPKSEKKDKSKDGSKDSKEGKKKKKVKVSLEPHEQNVFIDTDDAVFIWIYDPVHPKTFVLGILLVIGAVAVCLFPLWPESFRAYSWYLSVLAMVFIGLILFLAIFRYVIFGVVWGITFSKLHFWLLPNLTADCGFVESFIPLYEYAAPKATCECSESTGGKSEDTVRDEGQAEEDCQDEEKRVGVQSKEEHGSKNEEEEEKCKHSGKSDDKTDDSSGNGSGSNKDEGETWVKVQKSDVETNPSADNETTDEIKC